MSCPPPKTPSDSTFVVSLDGKKVTVSPSSHGTHHTTKQFHVVIQDGSATFFEDPYQSIVFDADPSPNGIFQLVRKSDCYIEIDDTPLTGQKIRYGFTVRVQSTGGEVFSSSDPTILNDPEDK